MIVGGVPIEKDHRFEAGGCFGPRGGAAADGDTGGFAAGEGCGRFLLRRRERRGAEPGRGHRRHDLPPIYRAIRVGASAHGRRRDSGSRLLFKGRGWADGAAHLRGAGQRPPVEGGRDGRQRDLDFPAAGHQPVRGGACLLRAGKQEQRHRAVDGDKRADPLPQRGQSVPEQAVAQPDHREKVRQSGQRNPAGSDPGAGMAKRLFPGCGGCAQRAVCLLL